MTPLKYLPARDIPNPQSSDGPEETVTIPKAEHQTLLQDSQFLRALEAAGVDNWDGYEYACGLSYKEIQKL